MPVTRAMREACVGSPFSWIFVPFTCDGVNWLSSAEKLLSSINELLSLVFCVFGSKPKRRVRVLEPNGSKAAKVEVRLLFVAFVLKLVPPRTA